MKTRNPNPIAYIVEFFDTLVLSLSFRWRIALFNYWRVILIQFNPYVMIFYRCRFFFTGISIRTSTNITVFIYFIRIQIFSIELIRKKKNNVSTVTMQSSITNAYEFYINRTELTLITYLTKHIVIKIYVVTDKSTPTRRPFTIFIKFQK